MKKKTLIRRNFTSLGLKPSLHKGFNDFSALLREWCGKGYFDNYYIELYGKPMCYPKASQGGHIKDEP